MTLFEIITLSFSFLAICASIYSLFQNNRISKRQSALEIKQTQLTEKQLELIHKEELEKQRAVIKLEIVGSHGSYKLIIRNDGFAPAFDVKIEIFPRGKKESPIIASDYESKFPLKKLDPGDEVELFWAISSATGTIFDSICKWKNQNGVEEIKETLLS